MINLIIIIIFIVWIFLYIKNKKMIRALPYLFMIFITPIYNILDSKIFVEIFGCGCVPIAQTNMFNIDFNANDLRKVIYSIISISMFILGIKTSKEFKTRKAKVIYNILIIAFNLILTYQICSLYMWG